MREKITRCRTATSCTSVSTCKTEVMTLFALLPQFIYWNPNPVAFAIFSHEVRWYALCWCVGLLLGYVVMQKLYKRQHIPDEKFDPLFFHIFFGVIIGARLGHCLFYEPGYFLSHPVEMIFPIQKTVDGWRCTGYAGLSSHGGVIGMLFALYLYVKRTGVNTMRILDNMGICAPLTACFIRLGNLFNSEIVGKTTDMPWGFIFAANGENFARHPGQLYESLAYITVFFIGLVIYHYNEKKVGTGFFFGWCITAVFVFRFLVEYIKDVQETFEQGMLLNMGQLLSIPFIIIGIYCLAGGKLCRQLGEHQK